MRFWTPRLPTHSCMTGPTNSWGTRMLAVMYGSRTSAISFGGGSEAGLSINRVSPSVVTISKTTVGAVEMRFRPYSRSRRSCTISMCSRPRKPQRKPKPSAAEDSTSKRRAASLRLQLVERHAQRAEVVRLYREQSGEHPRLYLLESRQRRSHRAAIRA